MTTIISLGITFTHLLCCLVGGWRVLVAAEVGDSPRHIAKVANLREDKEGMTSISLRPIATHYLQIRFDES